MPRAVLESLGLSKKEITVYLTALSLGKALVSTIAKKCGMKRTSAYATIEKLVQKGFLASFSKNKINYYSAIDPEILVDKCKQKVKSAQENLYKMEKILPVLASLNINVDKINVEFFNGFDGIKSMLNDVVLSQKAVNGILAIHKTSPRVLTYLENEYTPQRKEKMQGKSRIIVLDNSASLNFMQKNYKISQFEQIHFKEKLLPIDISIQIYGDKVGFYAFENEKNLYGILIQSETIVKTMNAMFLMIWEYALINNNFN